MGRKAAAATRPVHPGWSVRANTSTPRATVCIHEPMLETRAADQMSAKFRERSGRSEARGIARQGRSTRSASLVPHPPFDRYVRVSRIQLTDGLLDMVALPSGIGKCP